MVLVTENCFKALKTALKCKNSFRDKNCQYQLIINNLYSCLLQSHFYSPIFMISATETVFTAVKDVFTPKTVFTAGKRVSDPKLFLQL